MGRYLISSDLSRTYIILVVIGIAALLGIIWRFSDYILVPFYRLRETAIRSRTVKARVLGNDYGSSPLPNSCIASSPQSTGIRLLFSFDGHAVEMSASHEVALKAAVGTTGLLTYREGVAVDFEPLS